MSVISTYVKRNFDVIIYYRDKQVLILLSAAAASFTILVIFTFTFLCSKYSTISAFVVTSVRKAPFDQVGFHRSNTCSSTVYHLPGLEVV